MIKMTMIGYLGKDATSNDVGGQSVINFSACHTESWTDGSGEKKQKSVWADCSYWTKSTGILPYLKKGTQVYLEGTPGTRYWKGTDGQDNASLTLRVFSVQLLGSKNEVNEPSNQIPDVAPAVTESVRTPSAGGGKSKKKSVVEDDDDDLPF
jgi:single-strand DNA-binding protein